MKCLMRIWEYATHWKKRKRSLAFIEDLVICQMCWTLSLPWDNDVASAKPKHARMKTTMRTGEEEKHSGMTVMLPTIWSVLPRGRTRYKHCTCAMLINVHHSVLTEFSTLQMKKKKSLAQNSSLANGLHSVTRLEQKIVAQEITGNSWIFLTVLEAQVISQCL